MATKKMQKSEQIDKYSDFVYEITPTQQDEAKWLIAKGDFKDMDEFIQFASKMHIKIMKFEDVERESKRTIRLKKREDAKMNKAA